MNALVYCIEHEEMTHMECRELCGHIHYVPVYDDGGTPVGVDVEFCTYDLGFAFVPPPADLPEGWQDELQEPGVDELTGEDFNALELGQALLYFESQFVPVVVEV